MFLKKYGKIIQFLKNVVKGIFERKSVEKFKIAKLFMYV